MMQGIPNTSSSRIVKNERHFHYDEMISPNEIQSYILNLWTWFFSNSSRRINKYCWDRWQQFELLPVVYTRSRVSNVWAWFWRDFPICISVAVCARRASLALSLMQQPPDLRLTSRTWPRGRRRAFSGYRLGQILDPQLAATIRLPRFKSAIGSLWNSPDTDYFLMLCKITSMASYTGNILCCSSISNIALQLHHLFIKFLAATMMTSWTESIQRDFFHPTWKDMFFPTLVEDFLTSCRSL